MLRYLEGVTPQARCLDSFLYLSSSVLAHLVAMGSTHGRRQEAGPANHHDRRLANMLLNHVVCADMQVRSLCKQGSKVLVFSGKPVGYTAPDQAEGAQQLIQARLTPLTLHLTRQTDLLVTSAGCKHRNTQRLT